MKDEDQLHQHQHQHRHNQQRRIWNNNYFTAISLPTCKPTAYVILFFLSYALGYFSASSTTSITNPPPVTTPPLLTKLAANSPATSSPIDVDHYRFGPTCANPVEPELVRKTIFDLVFDGTSPYNNFPPAHVAHLLRPKRVKGWGSYGAVFENLIMKVRPKTIIEVGTFLGASATHMAKLTRKYGLSDTQIICLDDFRGWPGFQMERVNHIPILNGDFLLLQQFMQNVVYYNATGSIVPVPFSTGSGLQKLCQWGVMADLIEVDAGHDFHSAWSDINRAHKLLRPGGVMFGHDYFTGYDNKGVRRAVYLFAGVNGFKVNVDGQHWVLDSS